MTTSTIAQTVTFHDDYQVNFTSPSVEDSDDYSKSDLISSRAMLYFNIYFNLVLGGSLAVFGTVTNIINVIVFHKMGLADRMRISLMTLSLTDLLVSFFSLIKTVLYVTDFLLPPTHVSPLALQYLLGWWRDVVFLCSAWITTFLSVERCVCVVFPFKVKDIFTKFRTIVAMAMIYVVNIAVHLPVFVSQWLELTTEELDTSNGTVLKKHLVVRYSEHWEKITLYIDIANGVVLPLPSQALVIVSAIWMIFRLRASSTVRNVNYGTSNEQDPTNKKKSNLSPKEVRLMKVVLMLAMILTLCNIPRFMAVYAKQIFPEANFGKSFSNLYRMLWQISFVASTINSSVNIIVYLIINKRYLQIFKEIVCLQGTN